jgi:apolipoprotein D and lipocalin family protein
MVSSLRGPHAAFAALLVLSSIAALLGRHQAAPAVPVVPTLDPMRYSGTWYEVARLPSGEMRRCAADVTATYGLRPDGRYEVVDRCLRRDGSIDIVRGEARAHEGDRTGARLEVNFLPRWMRRLSVGWGEHWVVALDPDYRVAVVSDSERTELRVLSRVPEIEPERLVPLMAGLRAQGFAVDRLVRTPQGGAGLVPARTINVMT